MSKLFSGMILISFFYAACTGKMQALSIAAVTQVGEAVKLAFTLMGAMCLWSGLMRVAEEAGLAQLLSRGLRPLMKHLFRGLRSDGKAAQAVAINLAANMLGLGNAVTPLGIQAMREIAEEQNVTDTASDEMAMLVVLNTASLQLIPATVGMLRAQYGAQNPFDILPAVWAASIMSIIAGVSMARMLCRIGYKHGTTFLPVRKEWRQ